MGLFEFNKCCFCIDLKTGCFIIGYLSLIGYIVIAIGGIVALVIGGTIAASTEPNEEDKYIGIAVAVVAVMFLLLIILLLTFIIILLVGLHKNKPRHVKAYLVYASVFVVISVILFITSAVTGNKDAETLFENILNILLNIYFVLVIRSQYLVMKHPERGGPVTYTV